MSPQELQAAIEEHVGECTRCLHGLECKRVDAIEAKAAPPPPRPLPEKDLTIIRKIANVA